MEGSHQDAVLEYCRASASAAPNPSGSSPGLGSVRTSGEFAGGDVDNK
jgi:hypothetical protein